VQVSAKSPIVGDSTWIAMWDCGRCPESAKYDYLDSEVEALNMAQLYSFLHELQNHGA